MISKNIVVLGAGVSGLTTALLLARQGVHTISIVAKHMPGDHDIEYASPWAGANFAPVKRPAAALKNKEAAARITAYEEATWPELARLATEVPEAGIALQPFHILRRAEDTHDTWLNDLSQSTPEPWYKLPLRLRKLATDELPVGMDQGVEVTSVCINPALYLPWLVSQCITHGVTIHRAAVSHIAMIMGCVPLVDMIVNCTGLSSRHLGGVEDTSLYPIRGQVVLLRRHATSTPATMFSTSGTDADASDEVCYMMHRPQGGGTVVGGCLQRNNWAAEPDLELAARMIRRAVTLDPALANADANTEDRVSIIRHGVGLRPMRDDGPRVERGEDVLGKGGRKVAVVHNYGHGGAGYQMSYGCALEALRLVEMENALHIE